MEKVLKSILSFVKSPKFYGPIIIFVGAIFLYKLIVKILDKAIITNKNEYEKKKRKTIVLLFQNIVKYVITILALLFVLDIYGVDTSSIIAGLGVVGVVIGLALQDALKDIIGGINIIMDNYYIVGDLVTIGDFTGTVREFGLKSTKIVNAKGETLILANRNVDKIINLSQKKCVLFIKVPTAYECDSKEVEKVLNKVLNKVKEKEEVVESETEYLGVDEFDSSSVNYLIKIKCNQGKQFALRREVLGMIKNEYDKSGLKIPYDQVEVHHGQDL